MNISVALLFFTFVNFTVAQPIVTVGQMSFVGIFFRTRTDRLVSSFRGIPYAEPPIGNLRFRNPLPKKPSNGTFMAIKDGNMCVQNRFKNFKDEGSEDCLFLNVYTPQITKNQRQNLLPVMVYFHGGAYVYSSSNSKNYGPDYLLDKDVVLVTMNYRLGIFGFLSTGDSEAPGNFGLKDQVLGLRWVQENIRYFGGNPKKVTLFGLSAGANAVDFHTLSDTTNGLFHQYIMESGNSISPRSFQKRERYFKYAWAVGKLFNCPLNLSRLLVNCLRTVETKRLNKDSNSVFNDVSKFFKFTWSPTDEPNIDGAFLTDTPFKLLNKSKRKDYPWIQGMTKDEGVFFMGDLYMDDDLYNRIAGNLNKFITDLFETFPVVENITQVVRDVRQFYFQSNVMNDKNVILRQLSNFLGDFFRYPYEMMMTSWHSRNSKNPLYLYSFDYRGTISFSSDNVCTNINMGVDHGDETLYLFPIANSIYADYNLTMNKNDSKMIDTLVDLWTSFATNGVPMTSEASDLNIWKPYSPGKNILKIGDGSKTNLSIIHSLFEDRINFWSSHLSVIF